MQVGLFIDHREIDTAGENRKTNRGPNQAVKWMGYRPPLTLLVRRLKKEESHG